MDTRYTMRLAAPLDQNDIPAFAERLASIIHSDQHKLEALLSRGTKGLIRATSKDEAEKVAMVFRQAGLEVEVVPREQLADAAPPEFGEAPAAPVAEAEAEVAAEPDTQVAVAESEVAAAQEAAPQEIESETAPVQPPEVESKVEASEPERVEPSEPERVEVSEPERVEASEPEHVEPSEPESVEVSEPEHVEPSEPERVEAAASESVGDIELGRMEASVPAAVAPSEPQPEAEADTAIADAAEDLAATASELEDVAPELHEALDDAPDEPLPTPAAPEPAVPSVVAASTGASAGTRLLGLIGAALLIVGPFLANVAATFGVDLADLGGSRIAGMIMLILGVLSLIPIIMGRLRWLWLTGLAAVVTLVYAFVTSDAATDIGATLQNEWGWLVMLAGAVLLLLAGSLRRSS